MTQRTTELLTSMFCVMGQLAQALLATEAEDVVQRSWTVYEDDDPESLREYRERLPDRVDELEQRVKALEERLRALEGRPQGPMLPYWPDWTWRPTPYVPIYTDRNTYSMPCTGAPLPLGHVWISSQWVPQDCTPQNGTMTTASAGDGTAWVTCKDGAA